LTRERREESNGGGELTSIIEVGSNERQLVKGGVVRVPGECNEQAIQSCKRGTGEKCGEKDLREGK